MDPHEMWWKDAKIYELYVDKFAGDFRGLTSHLEYFVKLGINTLHILPHYPSPMIDDGYDIKDYRAVRPELGSLDDFVVFVQTAHAFGIRVITDFVLNHVSNQHPWFEEARSSKHNSKRDFFLWSADGHEFPLATNAFPDMKPSNWIRNEPTGDYYYATFYSEQPDLNWNNPELIKAMFAKMDYWADLGVDGFRLDAAPYLIKKEGTTCKGIPETHGVIKMIRQHLDEKYPKGVILLAEAHQSVAETKTYFGNGDECQMAYHFPLMEQFWLALQHENIVGVKNMISQSFDIPANCAWAVFLRNHDEISLATLPDDERIRLIDFLDPGHKYYFVKAKATSMRVASVFNSDKTKMSKAFELLYSTPGSPIMYYGDEIGMTNLPVGNGIIDTRKYVRGEFDWREAERQIVDPTSLFSAVATLTHRVRFETTAPPPALEVAG